MSNLKERLDKSMEFKWETTDKGQKPIEWLLDEEDRAELLQLIKAEIVKALDEVVPDEIKEEEGWSLDSWQHGHNDCRQEVLDKIKQIKEDL